MLLDLRSLYEPQDGAVVFDGPAATPGKASWFPVNRTRTEHTHAGRFRAGVTGLAAEHANLRVFPDLGVLASAAQQLGAADTLQHPARFLDGGRLDVKQPDQLHARRSVVWGPDAARIAAADDEWFEAGDE